MRCLGAGLEAVDIENLRRHYAMTLEHWTEFGLSSRVKKLQQTQSMTNIFESGGLSAGCAHAFHHHWVALHQIVATKSRAL
ncbi:class I SAM-dependent methyltransferase [Vibrio sp. PP-XX7]